MEIYLDNSATTQVAATVRDIMVETMDMEYGNPSSMHLKGVAAEKYIRGAKETLARILKVQEKEIFFTSGGTESNNMAIIGAAMAHKRRGMHLITTKIEHPCVTKPMQYLEEQGFEVTWLNVDEYGVVSLDELKNAIREDTILVSIMYVNNEIGAVQPIKEAAELIKKINPKTLFHVDAIQAFGKYQIYPSRMGIDLMSISGHKFHGPKGIGALYVKDKVRIRPLILGGGQQQDMRSGTENVPGIAGIGMAAKVAYTDFAEKRAHQMALKDFFIDEISKLDGAKVNSRKGEDGAPHIVSVSFEGVRSEVLLHSLEEKGIYVSAGSACSSNKPAVSSTLAAIGLPKNLLDSTLRFSFSSQTTKEELEYCIESLRSLLQILRRYRAK